MNAKQTKLVKEVRDLAVKQYDQGGHWLVECYSDEEILKEFSSVKEAQEMWKAKEENEKEHQAAREFYNDGKFWAEFYGVKDS